MEKWLTGIEGSNDAVRLENKSYGEGERGLGESPKSREHYINVTSSSFSSMEVKAQGQQSYTGKMGINIGTGEGWCQKEHVFVLYFGEVHLAMLKASSSYV